MGKQVSLCARVLIGSCAVVGTVAYPAYHICAGLIAGEDSESFNNYINDGRKALKLAYEVLFTGEVPRKERRIIN